MTTSNSDQLQELIAEIQTDQSKLQEAVAVNSNRLTLLTDRIEDTIIRLESLERSRDTRGCRSSAGSRLASIPELLEVVLLHLPIRDLLLAQRVSRCFKALIDRSQTIQGRLFFLPESEPPGLRETDVRINPLLVDEKSFIGIPLYRNKDTPPRPVFVMGSQWNSRKVRVASCELETVKDRSNGRSICQAQIKMARLPGTICYDCPNKVGKSTSGSWRKMYLTQPPVKIWYSFVDSSGGSQRWLTGLTFGNHFPWKLRRGRRGNEGDDMDGPSDGSEIDAPENEE